MKSTISLLILTIVIASMATTSLRAEESVEALERVKEAYKELRVAGMATGNQRYDGRRVLTYLPPEVIAAINAMTFDAYNIGRWNAANEGSSQNPWVTGGQSPKVISPIGAYEAPGRRTLFGEGFSTSTEAAGQPEEMKRLTDAEQEAIKLFKERYERYLRDNHYDEVVISDYMIRSLPRDVYATSLKVFAASYALGYDDERRGKPDRGKEAFQGFDRKPPKHVLWAGNDGTPTEEACQID